MSVLTAEQHDQHTVWKDGIDIEECWPWCRVCKINALRKQLEQEEAENDSLSRVVAARGKEIQALKGQLRVSPNVPAHALTDRKCEYCGAPIACCSQGEYCSNELCGYVDGWYNPRGKVGEWLRVQISRMPCGHLRAELDTIRVGQGPGTGKQYCSGCEREQAQIANARLEAFMAGVWLFAYYKDGQQLLGTSGTRFSDVKADPQKYMKLAGIAELEQAEKPA